MAPFLFVTDLDNTLVGDRAALETLNERLRWHRYNYGSKIVYATGRSLPLYRELAQEQALLHPDALIAYVGTTIYPDPHTETPDPEWSHHLESGWERVKITAIASNYSQLNPQPDSEQGAFKSSYFLAPEDAETILPALESRFAAQQLDVQIIYSGGRDLDILPAKGNKGYAVQYLRQKWGFYRYNTVVCGDSGNDISLFSTEGVRGVLVGNAMPELRQWYRDNANDNHYLARSRCAGGILEGLQHFGFLP